MASKRDLEMTFRRESGVTVNIQFSLIPTVTPNGVKGSKMVFNPRLLSSLKNHEFQRLLEQAAHVVFPLSLAGR